MTPNSALSQTVTFNNKVKLPAMKLGQGTYFFRLVGGDQSQQQVIQVYSWDGSEFYGNILAIPDSGITVAKGDNIVKYPMEISHNIPAVRAWVPSSGPALVLAYPKSEATKPAKINNLTVT
jgi:hypothetical protein